MQEQTPSPTDPTANNFGLTPEAFLLLVAQLQAGDETLFEKIFLAHFSNCLNLLKTKYAAQHEDAYDAGMDALVRFRKYLLLGKVTHGNLKGYFNRVAVTGYLKKMGLQREIPTDQFDENLPDIATSEIDDVENIALLGKAWDRLGEGCRALLQAFCYDKIELKKIAARTGDREASTRKKKERCIKDLRRLFYEIELEA